jgi:hypothetical protein
LGLSRAAISGWTEASPKEASAIACLLAGRTLAEGTKCRLQYPLVQQLIGAIVVSSASRSMSFENVFDRASLANRTGCRSALRAFAESQALAREEPA